jgi:hypothetical protein
MKNLIQQEEAEAAQVVGSGFSAFSASSCSKAPSSGPARSGPMKSRIEQEGAEAAEVLESRFSACSTLSGS